MDARDKVEIICGKHRYMVATGESHDEIRLYTLTVDSTGVQETFHLSAYVYPQFRFMVSEEVLAIWGGQELYVVDHARPGMRLATAPWPIFAVYQIGAWLCLVEELGVAIRDTRSLEERGRYEHHDVLLHHRWEGDRLIVEDFIGQTLRFDLSAAALTASTSLRSSDES